MHHDCPVVENQMITTHVYVVLGLLKEIIVDPKLAGSTTVVKHSALFCTKCIERTDSADR